MQAQHLLARHREHGERIIVAQVGLDRERKPHDVVERLHVAGFRAGGIEALAEMRDAVIRALQALPQAGELQRRKLVAPHRFCARVEHVGLSGGPCTHEAWARCWRWRV
jgi:hypothetical protein